MNNKNNLQRLVHHLVRLAEFLEQAEHRPSIWSRLPRKGAHCVAVDIYVLYGGLKKGRVPKCNEKAIVALDAEPCATSFVISKLQREVNREFTCIMESDGVSISAHFQRIK